VPIDLWRSFTRGSLAAATYGASESQEISHAEVPLLVAGEGRPPFAFSIAIRSGIAIDQAKQHLGNNASAYITQPLAASSDLSLFEDVVKERRLTMIACFGQANLVFG